MGKVFVGLLAVIVVGTLGFMAITVCLTCLKALFGWGHIKLRSDTLEAREAVEDLEDAVRREKKRKEEGL